MSVSTPVRPTRRTLFYDSPSRPRRDNELNSLLQETAATNHLSTPKKKNSPYLSKVIGKSTSPLKNDATMSDYGLVGSNSKLNTPKSKRCQTADRFIPNRQATHNTAKCKIEEDNNSKEENKNTTSATSSSLAEACGVALNTRILEFQPAAPQSSKPIDLRTQYNRPLKPTCNAQMRRKVPTAPERVLDAPGLIDDYYLNLLDWSCGNQVAIALEQSVYIWDASSGTVSALMEGDSAISNYVSGVKWSGDGAYLSIGMSDGDVQIWDVEEQTKLRSMTGHSARVGVMSWDKHIVSSGCRDGSIWNHDVRIADHKIAELNNHSAEVCGLDWRSDGSQLASGGNDNVVNIWDARSTSTPKFSKTNHKAAVKALAWCPWQMNLLATGGGSQDKFIHFWNSTTGARVNSIDTDSQVTSLKWSSNYKEIVSAHGFPDNHLTIWSYPSLTKNVEIVAHDSRVLHSSLSPDGQTLATCAADENLKFWKIFEQVGKKASSASSASSTIASKEMSKSMVIR